MKNYLRAGFLSSLAALGVATCCVLPMVMLLLGLGGSWLAVFGKIAAASYYVLALSVVLVALGWLMAYRRGTLARMKPMLLTSTALTAIAWVVVFNEARINDLLMTWM